MTSTKDLEAKASIFETDCARCSTLRSTSFTASRFWRYIHVSITKASKASAMASLRTTVSILASLSRGVSRGTVTPPQAPRKSRANP